MKDKKIKLLPLKWVQINIPQTEFDIIQYDCQILNTTYHIARTNNNKYRVLLGIVTYNCDTFEEAKQKAQEYIEDKISELIDFENC